MESTDRFFASRDTSQMFVLWEILRHTTQMYIEAANRRFTVICGNKDRFVFCYPYSKDAETNFERFVQELKQRMKTQDDKLESVQLQLEEIQSKLEQVWNAPGMPGYVEAQNSFDQHRESQRV